MPFVAAVEARLHGGPDAVSHGQSRLVALSRGVLRKKRLFIFLMKQLGGQREIEVPLT
jgi:hypothetical protein